MPVGLLRHCGLWLNSAMGSWQNPSGGSCGLSKTPEKLWTFSSGGQINSLK